MDIKQEDSIKFWAWCGWTQYPTGRDHFHYEQTKKVMDWIAPRGHFGNMGYLPRLELTEIYEYAIPKLQNMGLAITLIAFEESGFNVRIVTVVPRTLTELADERANTPTEALYNAIMKVIDNEVK
jgi:hypothetical protein